MSSMISQACRLTWTKAIRYADLFRWFVRPKLMDHKTHWDNRSPQLVGNSIFESKITSYEGCRSQCQADSLCLQFSYMKGGHCKISRSVLLGEPSEIETESGWFLHRIDKFIKKEGTCAAQWILG